jgi:Xaa-Pro aminopeptidase
MSEFGLTVPVGEGGFCAIDPVCEGGYTGLRRMTSDRILRAGEFVTLSGGVFFSGYEGAVGRTAICDSRHQSSSHSFKTLLTQWDHLWGHMIHALRPGATGGDLRRAYLSSGVGLPQFPIATSVGLGLETPIAGNALGEQFDEQWTLCAGMVLQVQGLVTASQKSYFGLETVLITENEPEALSTLSHGAHL